MKKVADYFKKVAEDLKILEEDIIKIVDNKKQTKKSDNKEGLSLRSLSPLTRIRASKEDIESAKENPELTFIEDKLKDILE